MYARRKAARHEQWVKTAWPDRMTVQPPQCPRRPRPGERRLSLDFPRIKNSEGYAALTLYTNQWEDRGWQIFATMHNDSLGVVSIHMGVREEHYMPGAYDQGAST